MSGAVRRPAQLEVAAALEDPVQARLGEIRVMEDPAQAASDLFVVKIIGR